jgi:hypothetical protein
MIILIKITFLACMFYNIIAAWTFHVIGSDPLIMGYIGAMIQLIAIIIPIGCIVVINELKTESE